MGRLFVLNLEGKIYSCKYCRTHLALSEDVVSKSFHCRHGKAYLFNKVVNVTLGEIEDRLMMTGMHSVADIFCVGCGSIVGWKYETAHEPSQKYKEGKSVLERSVILSVRVETTISINRSFGLTSEALLQSPEVPSPMASSCLCLITMKVALFIWNFR